MKYIFFIPKVNIRIGLLGLLFLIILFLFPINLFGQVERLSSEGVGLLQYRLRPMNMLFKTNVILDLNKGFDLSKSEAFSPSGFISLELQYDPLKTHKEDIFLIVSVSSAIKTTYYGWRNGARVTLYTSKRPAYIYFKLKSIDIDGKENLILKDNYDYFGRELPTLSKDYFHFKLSREMLNELKNAQKMTFIFTSKKGDISFTFNDIRKFNLLDEKVRSDPFWIYSQPGFEKLPPINQSDFFNSLEINKTKKPKSLLNVRAVNLYSHTDFVTEVAISTDGNTIASGSWDNYVTFWDPKTQNHLKTAEKAGLIAQIVFHPSDRTVVTRSLFDKNVKVWDSKDGSLIHILEAHTGPIKDVAFNSNGELLATAGEDKVINLWDVKTGNLISTFSGHSDKVTSVRFVQSANILISGSKDKTVRLWDIEKTNQIASFEELNEPVELITLNNDGSLFSAATEKGKIGIWDLENKEFLFVLNGHSKPVRDILFCPDDTLLASCSEDKTIKLWDVRNGNLVYDLKGHKGIVKDITFSPDGKLLASGGYDKTIILWRTETGKALLTLTGHEHTVNSIVFNHEGTGIVSGSADRTVMWWELPLIE